MYNEGIAMCVTIRAADLFRFDLFLSSVETRQLLLLFLGSAVSSLELGLVDSGIVLVQWIVQENSISLMEALLFTSNFVLTHPTVLYTYSLWSR